MVEVFLSSGKANLPSGDNGKWKRVRLISRKLSAVPGLSLKQVTWTSPQSNIGKSERFLIDSDCRFVSSSGGRCYGGERRVVRGR